MAPRAVGALMCALLLAVAGCATESPSAQTTPTPAASAVPTPIASPDPTPVGTATPAASPEPTPLAVCATAFRIGLVADIGRLNDGGLNQSTLEGVEAAIGAAPSCFQLEYIETASRADFPNNIVRFADGGSDIIIGVGPAIADSLGEAAANRRDLRFIDVDGVPGPGRDQTWSMNGESLVFAEDQLGYLAGVLAASVSETGHIGVVGGPVTMPAYERFVEGFSHGAIATRPDIVVDIHHVASLDEPADGYAGAAAMTDAGADVIFAAANVAGNGALLSACDASRMAIGANTDQYLSLLEAQRCLLTSVVKGVAPAVRDALLRISTGRAASGVTIGNAATDGIGLAPFYENADRISADVEELLRVTLRGLADGSITTNVVVDGNTSG